MGNLNSNVKTNSNPHAQDPIYDVKKIYWDQDGNLRYGVSERNRDEEIIKILQTDSHEDEKEDKLWMIVPSRWIRQWLLFAHFKVCEAPGKIDMFLLLKQDAGAEGGWRPKKTLLPPIASEDPKVEDHPGHYRRVSFEVWTKLIDMYGLQGYAIAVRGAPYDDKSRWRVFKNPRLIDINLLPEPILKPKPDENEKGLEKKDNGNKKEQPLVNVAKEAPSKKLLGLF